MLLVGWGLNLLSSELIHCGRKNGSVAMELAISVLGVIGFRKVI